MNRLAGGTRLTKPETRWNRTKQEICMHVRQGDERAEIRETVGRAGKMDRPRASFCYFFVFACRRSIFYSYFLMLGVGVQSHMNRVALPVKFHRLQLATPRCVFRGTHGISVLRR
jgi:hypothetical protein